MDSSADPQKEHFADLFHRSADTYDAVEVEFFGPLAAALVDRAQLEPGTNVLDLGVGTGAALRAIADAVGPSGTALGIDLAPGMVARTARELADRQQVRVEVGDAERPPGREGGWDAVVAALVLFYLPDPAAACARVRGVLRRGGVFVASSFESGDDRWSIVEGAVSPFWPPMDGPSHPSGSSPFASVAAVESLMREAGFVDVDTTIVKHVNVYSDVDHWLRWTWSGGARGMWERVAADQLEDAQAAACDVVRTLAEPDGSLRETFHVRLTRGVAP